MQQTITNITVSTAAPPMAWTPALDSVNEQLHAGRIAGPLGRVVR